MLKFFSSQVQTPTGYNIELFFLLFLNDLVVEIYQNLKFLDVFFQIMSMA